MTPVPHPNEARDNFERLEFWVGFKVGRRLTGDERGQLVNMVRALMGDVFMVAKGMIGEQQ